MTTPTSDNLLPERPGLAVPGPQANLDAMVDRIRAIAAGPVAAREPPAPSSFVPQEPKSFRAAGLNDSLVESLALKHLLARGDSTGREVADHLKLPFLLIDELLRGLKSRTVDRLCAWRR